MEEVVCRLLHLALLLEHHGRKVAHLIEARALIRTPLQNVQDAVEDILDEERECLGAELAAANFSCSRGLKIQLASSCIQGLEEFGEETFGSDATVGRHTLVDEGGALAEGSIAWQGVRLRQPAAQALEAARRDQG